jgi:acetyl-CoA acetyltransferase
MRFKLLRRRLTISAPRMAIRSAMPWPVRWVLAAIVLGFCAAIALWAFEFGKGIAGLDSGAKEELARLREEVSRLRDERDRAQSVASTAARLGCKPLARIVSHAVHAQEPEWFATAPVGATQKALAKAGWSVGDVDLWEVNEAFAVVPMALMKELNLSHEIVNVNGGACALGHPIGASGARIMVTLIHALKARGLKKGLATLCIGGGEATAVALELL